MNALSNPRFNRRLFLKSSFWLVGLKNVFAHRALAQLLNIEQSTTFLYQKDLKPFYHGVASGDPLSDGVIIWTRLTDDDPAEKSVAWAVAKDADFQNIIQTGTSSTNAAKDFTIKVDVRGLAADTYYYYRFSFADAQSVVGRTKTLPIGDIQQANLIAVSCNAYEGGYFGAYQQIAARTERIDAVLHLGDYIYEDFLPQYIEFEARTPLPQKRCVTLADYRTRYAQYRLDHNLQAAHQMHPFINIWDDHELANDAYATGAAGHNPLVDGDYLTRKQSALQCFLEWLPTRIIDSNCKRAFPLGNLADVILLDERTERSEEQGTANPHFQDADRGIMSSEQFNWLTNQLKISDKRWKIIGNQVLFSPINTSMMQATNPEKKLDNWSGYPSQQQALSRFLATQDIKNTIFVSGDSHCSWALNVPDLSDTENNSAPPPCAVEIGVPSISSGTWGDKVPTEQITRWEQQLLALNPHLKYTNLSHHGYVHLVLSPSNVIAHWYAVDKSAASDAQQRLAKSMTVSHDLVGISEK